jgi:5-methylcytosine-specific restriction enzyme A
MARIKLTGNALRKRNKTRLYVLKRDKCICYLCGFFIDLKEDFTIDHVIPVVDGGSDEEHNLKAAHFVCNCAKQSMSLQQFRAMAAIWAAKKD